MLSAISMPEGTPAGNRPIGQVGTRTIGQGPGPRPAPSGSSGAAPFLSLDPASQASVQSDCRIPVHQRPEQTRHRFPPRARQRSRYLELRPAIDMEHYLGDGKEPELHTGPNLPRPQ